MKRSTDIDAATPNRSGRRGTIFWFRVVVTVVSLVAWLVGVLAGWRFVSDLSVLGIYAGLAIEPICNGVRFMLRPGAPH